jgi:predicted transcriptional regulator
MGELNVDDVKAETRRLIDALPPDATWDDLMERIFVRQMIEAGLKDADAGRTVSVEDVRGLFGLPE